jgi:hypothetical protein
MFVKEGAAWYMAPSHLENIWLRTKRYNASGKVVSGTGGVCYLFWPAHPTAAQRAALAAVGVH